MYHHAKICIVDTIFPKGHRYLNSKLLEAISEYYSIDVINNYSYYKDIKLKNVNIIDKKQFRLGKNKLLNHLKLILNGLFVSMGIKSKKYDAIIFFTFDTINFALIKFLFRNKNIILIHHDNTARLKDKFKYQCFQKYRNKVKHIVFSPILKQYLITEIGVDSNLIFDIPHPLPADCYEIKDIKTSPKIILSTGYANDETLIKDIIEYEETNHILEKNGIIWKIRSSNITYEGASLSIFNEHISQEEYNELYNNAYSIVLLYSNEYAYRFSGVLFDGLTHGRIILGPPIALVNYYNEKYPNMCIIFNNTSELVNEIASLKYPSKECIECIHQEIITQSSQSNIAESLRNVIAK